MGTWVLIPCIAGATFRRTDEKLSGETGDFVMSYKSVVAAVGMSRRAVGSGDIVVCGGSLACMLSRMSCKRSCSNRCCTVKEALGILGVFRTLISVLQAWSLGWTRFVEVTWTPMALSVLGLLTRFFGMYELVNLFFSAANLSLLNHLARTVVLMLSG